MVGNEQIQQLINQLMAVAAMLEASAAAEAGYSAMTDPEQMKEEMIASCNLDRKAAKKIREIMTQMSAWTE